MIRVSKSFQLSNSQINCMFLSLIFSKANLGIISSNWLPDPKIIIKSVDRIIKAFENVIQTELVRVRWEEIKRLEPVLSTT